jgi:glycosyltransferase involved in cell wall biosynthesis
MAINSEYTLAAVYIVKNEEKNLAVSLPSVTGIADEIIVLDSGSSDGTESLCDKFKVSYYKNEDWPGFGIQRQRAQSKATSDWILMLDADEEIDNELKESIKNIKTQKPGDTVYSLKRLDCLFGKTIDSPNWIVPIKAHKRLYPRKAFKFCDSPVHESLQTNNSQVIPLEGYLLHNTAHSAKFWLDKRLGYAHSWAQKRSSKNMQSGFMIIIVHTFFSFFKQYLIDGRFLSGKTGFIYSMLFMSYTFNKYAMLFDLNQQSTIKPEE